MTNESEKFRFSDVEWIYTQSREITNNPKPPIRTGIKAVTATCNGCGHTWRAQQYGDGKLLAVIGGVIVNCPECGADEHIPGRSFEQ